MARSLDKSIRDCTGNVIPILFFFALTAYITTTLIYSSGHHEPVPGRVSIGFLTTLGVLVFGYTLGRMYGYYKGPPEPEPDEERPTSRESRMHPTMAPVPVSEVSEKSRESFPPAPVRRPTNPSRQHGPLQRDAAPLPPPPDVPPPQARQYRPYRPAPSQGAPHSRRQHRTSPASPLTPSRIPRPQHTGPAYQPGGHSRQTSADFVVVTGPAAQAAAELCLPSRAMRGGLLQGEGRGSHGLHVNVAFVGGNDGARLLEVAFVSDKNWLEGYEAPDLEKGDVGCGEGSAEIGSEFTMSDIEEEDMGKSRRGSSTTDVTEEEAPWKKE